MVRLFALAVSIGMFLATGVAAQQSASVLTGKWEVSITGQPLRLLELTADGPVVTGTLTKNGSSAAKPVTGELKGDILILQTKARDEFFTVVFWGDGLHGTYVYDGGAPENCYKTGVKLWRPAN